MNPKITRRAQIMRLIAISVLSVSILAPSVALAANKYWIGGTDWWDVGTNWNPVGQPQNGDYVYLTQSDAVNRTIMYRNTAYPSAVLQSLVIDATGAGTITLSQTYNSLLSSNQEYVGYNGAGSHFQSMGSNYAGSLYVNGSGYYSLSGSGNLGSNYEYITGIFRQTGGTNSVGTVLYVGPGSGTYELSGGNLTAPTEIINDNGNFTQNNPTTFIQSGGTHTVTGNLKLWGGSYNLSGSGSLVVANENIGGYNNPTFIQSGGVHTINNNLTLGKCAGQAGYYTLDGGSLSIGGNISRDTCGGAGILKIDGGTLTVGGGNGTITTYDFYVGSTASSNGSHTLSGTGSLMATNREYIGYSGFGTFHQNGGTNITPTLSIGANAGSNGVYNLNGGTLIAGVVTKGAGTSTLNINAGVLSVGSTFDPSNASGGPRVPNNPNVLGGGNGSIDVVNLNVGDAAGSNGNHTLSGTGTITVVNETIGNFGTGTLTQTGGTHTITNTLTLAANAGSSGAYNLNNGALRANTITVNSGGNFNFNGGTLSVGQFTGNLANLGGTLAPGNSPGITNVTGNYSQSGAGTFAVEIGGTGLGQFDMLNISGTATLDGTLNVSLFDFGSGLFAPQVGDSFDILAAQMLSGQFNTYNLVALGDGLAWNISYLTDAIDTTDIVRLSVVSAVPLPPAFWLFGSGILGLAGIARRRKFH